jgi:hypothetical protein
MGFCQLEGPEMGQNVEAASKPHHHVAIITPMSVMDFVREAVAKGKEVGGIVSHRLPPVWTRVDTLL